MPRLERDAVSLYYEVHGEGPWLAFAHGAGGNGLSWWQQVPAFASRHRCLVYDQRGWGRSPSAAPPDPAAFAGDLAALLDHLEVERAALVGQSMGGWTVVGCALLGPERITHLALVGTLGGLTDDELLSRLLRMHATSGGAGFDPHRALAADFPDREPALTFLYDEICALNPLVSQEFLVKLLQLRHTASAARLEMPVRFIAGAHDQLFPLDIVRAAHAHLPAAELVVLPEAGHSAYFECAGEFNAALAELLKR
jgi:pimeloyl-ACP methyl ester carboxylesterase